MSSSASPYDIANGALVEIKLSDTIFRGELNLQLFQISTKNPAQDRIVLESPLELPSGKKHTGTVSFPVKDIRQSKFTIQFA